MMNACQSKHRFMTGEGRARTAVCPTHTGSLSMYASTHMHAHTDAASRCLSLPVAGSLSVYSAIRGGSWEAAIFSSGFIILLSLLCAAADWCCILMKRWADGSIALCFCFTHTEKGLRQTSVDFKSITNKFTVIAFIYHSFYMYPVLFCLHYLLAKQPC